MDAINIFIGGLDAWPVSPHNAGMPKRSSKPKKKQKDTQQIARRVLDSVVPDAEPVKELPAKNPAAVALGRLGGQKGGRARAASLDAKTRAEIAKKAAQARWSKRS
jgi:hypothetical protein